MNKQGNLTIALFLGSVVSVLLFLGGCAPPSITSRVLVPAKYSEAANLRRMAVLPFTYDNRKDDDITADIEATIASARIDGRPYFSVVERTHLNRILDEQRLGMTGIINEKTAVKVGKIAGVEAVLIGNITDHGMDRARNYETRSYCSRKNKKGKCESWGERRVSCITRTAIFSYVPKLIDVSSGRLVVSESISRQESSRECDDERGPTDSELLSRVKASALEDFKNMIAPHYVMQSLTLLTMDNSTPPTHINEKLNGGITFAQAGRMDRACTLWEEAYYSYQHGYTLPYLLGVCAEIKGELVNAKSFYTTADSRTMTPVKEINEALTRIDTKVRDQVKLGEQLTRHRKSSVAENNILQQVQKRLSELGYQPGPIDGLMGHKTSHAIRQYQQDNGLTPTGNVDSETTRLLDIKY